MRYSMRARRTSSVKSRLAEQRKAAEYQAVPTSPPGEVVIEELTWGEKVLESHTYMNVMASIIVANAVVIGLETDMTSFAYWDYIEAIFLVIFVAEIVFKMWVEGWLFFHVHEHDFLWNIFDLTVVGLGIFDLVSSMLSGSSAGFATIFRTARLMRVLRIIRLIKVLKPIFMLAVGLIEACKAIIWVTILMGTVLYVFAIVLVKTVGQVDSSDPNHYFLHEHFHNIPDCMITLFVLMSSPNLPIYQDEDGLLDSRPLFCVFLVIFICFGSFGMIAMLTGVINESMFENNELRRHEKKLEHETMRASLGRHAADLYETLPLDGRGCAKVEDLKKISHAAAELLDEAGVQIAHGDIVRFLELTDDNESGYIDMVDFVHAIEKMAEGLGPLAIIEVQHYAALTKQKVFEQVEKIILIERQLEKQIEDTSDHVDKILSVITSEHSEHRSHLVEKLDFQLQRALSHEEKMLQVLASQSQVMENIEKHVVLTKEGVEQILQVVTDGESMGSRSAPRATDPDPGSGVHVLSEIRRCETAVLAAISNQTTAVHDAFGRKLSDLERQLSGKEGSVTAQSTIDRKLSDLQGGSSVIDTTDRCIIAVQHAVDRKFQDLERHLALKASSDKCVQLAASSQMQDISASLHRVLHEPVDRPKLDAILSLVQDLNKKEEDIARLMQESKNSAVRVAKAHDTVNDSVDILTRKVSTLETQLLASVAELGGDIIGSTSELLSSSMAKLKQEVMLQSFHSLSSTREPSRDYSREFYIPSGRDSPSLATRPILQTPQPILQTSQRQGISRSLDGLPPCSPQRKDVGFVRSYKPS